MLLVRTLPFNVRHADIPILRVLCTEQVQFFIEKCDEDSPSSVVSFIKINFV